MAAKKASTKKASTKKDLETKIAELEAKLSKLATQLEAPKPAESPKPESAKPAEAPKPEAAKPAETKPAEAPKPEAPKPAEATPPAPVTFQAALEDAYNNATMTSFHDYKAKVTGYSPAPNRYHVRRTAPVGRVPTTNWNDQKLKVTGYTSASNQYFATRARMAYHPADKTFGSFSGVTMSVEGVEIKAQTQQAPPPEVAKPKDGKLPKETVQVQNNEGKSKKQSLEEYESDYMNRMADEQRDNEELMTAAAELRAKRQAESPASDSPSKKGALPKGF
jgi:hypothetical protein